MLRVRVGLPTTPTLVASLSGTAAALAIALLNDELFVTRYGINTVSVYSTITFQPLPSITNSYFGTIMYGLATSASDNYLYVADNYYSRVHRIDLTGTVIPIYWSVTYPGALSVTSGNTILVSSNPTTILEFTPSGSLVKSITTTSTPWQIVQVNNSVWAATQWDALQQICTVSPSSRTQIKCFGSVAGNGITPAMNWPRGLAVDTRGYMLLADYYNNRILLVDPTLTSASQLQLPVSPALSGPMSVSYVQSLGRLYVGEYYVNYRVLVFDGIWW